MKKINFTFLIKNIFIIIFFLLFFTNEANAENITITSFFPGDVLVGGNLKILGTNFNGIKEVSINNKVIDSNLYTASNYNGAGMINVTIPTGTTTGKITILTESNGTVTTTTDLKILTVEQMDESVDKFVEDNPEYISKIGEVKNENIYKFLAPIGKITCMDNTGKDLNCISNNIGKYLNFIFKFLIGLSVALAVVMMIIAGITYMGDESIFGKTEAKSKMKKAILGLLIALGSFALLNTINPDLTGKGGLTIDRVSFKIDSFSVSGSSTFDGKPIKINFNKEAYPAAKIASQKTGVETAFILAMFAQETSSGSNTGTCNYTNANMGTGQLDSLKTVVTRLNAAYPDLKLTYQTTNMSCSGGGSSHGGAIGYTQFLPGTWLQYSNQAKQALGHEPNPWNTADALMMTAFFLKDKGGSGSNVANQEAAACKYFGSCSVVVSCGDGVSGTYGQCILGKKVSIQKQIDESIKNGEIN